jgi:hypothetical protein
MFAFDSSVGRDFVDRPHRNTTYDDVFQDVYYVKWKTHKTLSIIAIFER